MSEDWIGQPLDLLLGWTPGMVMPSVVTPDDRQWHPEDAFQVRKDGKTFDHATASRTASEDAWVFWRKKHRLTFAWRDLSRRCAQQAADDARTLQARQIVRRLIETGRIDMTDIPESDAARAEEALTVLVSVVKNGAEATKDRIAAAKALLDFTRQKPASKSDVTVKSALDWLDEVSE